MKRLLFVAVWVSALTMTATAGSSIADDPSLSVKEIRIPPCETAPSLARIAVDMIPALPTPSKVVDLGSGRGNLLFAAVDPKGQGRIAASTAIGYELDQSAVEESREKIQALGLSDRVTVVEQTLWAADLSEADAVFVAGHSPIMEELELMLHAKMKPGAYVLCIDHPLPHTRLLQETTVELGEGAKRDCVGRESAYAFLYLYQMPRTKDAKEYRRQLMDSSPSVTLRHIDVPLVAEAGGEGQTRKANTATVHRVEICPPHKRASCIECHLLVRDNTAVAASLNLESYSDITNQHLVVRASTPGETEKTELLSVVVKTEDLRQHGAHMFFYTYNLTTPLVLSREAPESIVSISMELASEPNPHLTFYYVMSGTDHLRDGSYDLVATPRSLGVFFTIWIQAPRLSFWVRRHGRIPPTHFEVLHRGVRVLNEVLDPGTVAGAMGFVDALRDLTFQPTESVVLKAVFIEPTKEFRYEFAVDDWNATIRDTLLDQHDRQRAEFGEVTFRPTGKTRVNRTTASDPSQWPQITLSLFSKFHTPTILGVRLTSDQRLAGPILLLWYVPGYSQQFLATECQPTWVKDRDGPQTVCEVHHVVVSALAGVERVEWDLWFDTAKHARATAAPGAVEDPFHAWLLNGGINFGSLAANDVLSPKEWGLSVSESVRAGDTIFSVPSHLVIRSHCVLCRADWYQQLFEHVSHRAPAVHYALEMAKLALYSLPAAEVPFHTDEFTHLAKYVNKLRRITRQQPVDLPMKRSTALLPEEEGRLNWEEAQVVKTGLLQNAALSTFHAQLLQHDNSSAWFSALFPSAAEFVAFVAETAVIVFPEISAFPVLPQVELSMEPSAAFVSDSNNISVVANRPLQAGERVSLGCNALYHVMWLFKGRSVADRLKGAPRWEDSPKGACQPSVLLGSGLILSKAEQSLDLALRFFGDRLTATTELKTYLLHAEDERHKEILSYNIQHLTP